MAERSEITCPTPHSQSVRPQRVFLPHLSAHLSNPCQLPSPPSCVHSSGHLGPVFKHFPWPGKPFPTCKTVLKCCSFLEPPPPQPRQSTCSFLCALSIVPQTQDNPSEGPEPVPTVLPAPSTVTCLPHSTNITHVLQLSKIKHILPQIAKWRNNTPNPGTCPFWSRLLPGTQLTNGVGVQSEEGKNWAGAPDSPGQGSRPRESQWWLPLLPSAGAGVRGAGAGWAEMVPGQLGSGWWRP